MNPREVLDRNQGAISALCIKYGVVRLRVFGSALRDDWDESSDFDFVAEFGPPPPGINLFRQQFGLLVELEALLSRPVDLVDWAATTKDSFKKVVDDTAVDLYAA
ncbi:MAG: nucleotidyltransferase domain-containing protein [Fimbriimonadaceae bacterium]|nr:nucleotidyltransferase domain-containing protein [Fimbriimonadaceae bacterium]